MTFGFYEGKVGHLDENDYEQACIISASEEENNGVCAKCKRPLDLFTWSDDMDKFVSWAEENYNDYDVEEPINLCLSCAKEEYKLYRF